MSSDDAPRQVEDIVPEEAAGGDVDSPRAVTPMLLRRWPLPEPTGTKYSRGQVLVVGGARSTPGGAMLAGRSALCMGAGRLSLAVAESISRHVAVAVPECGTIALPEDESGSVTGERAGDLLRRELARADAVLVGPGLADAEGSLRLLTEVVRAAPESVPFVLDAFGLTTLPDAPPEVAHRLAGRLVATPNTGELARLLGTDEVDDEDVARGCLDIASRYDAVVACDTWIAGGGRLWQITTGDTGLGTSGSGDVVAGATVGLLSRGAGRVQSVSWAKYVHAAAGDALSVRFGRVGYLAGELPAQLPLTLRCLGGD